MEITNEEVLSNEQKVTNARNTLTVLEADTLRLRKLRVSEEYTIGELLKQKKELQSEINALSEQRDIVKKESESYHSDLESAKKTFEGLMFEMKEQSKKHTEAGEEIEKRLGQLVEQETNFERKSKELSLRENNVLERESSVSDKLLKIEEIITLCKSTRE